MSTVKKTVRKQMTETKVPKIKTPKDADYDTVIAEVYSRLKKQHEGSPSIAYQFEKKLLEEVTRDLVKSEKILDIRNIPDIKYTYDARKDFPASIANDGFWAITGRGKGKYTFETIPKNNLIRVPADIKGGEYNYEVVIIKDETPAAVAAVLGDDEQATMTRIRYNNILTKFLGMDTFQVQGHERTNLSCGQIEVDEVYVGEKEGIKYVIPISGKGGDKDRLSYTQALNLSIYANEKKKYGAYTGIPLGVLRHGDGNIYILQFTCSTIIQELKIVRIGVFKLV